MSTIRENIIPNLEDWPIYKIHKEHASFVDALNKESLARIRGQISEDLESLLNKTVYLEKLRTKNNPLKVDPSDDKTYWYSLSQEIKNAGQSPDKDASLNTILERIVNRYNEEIVGSFKIKTYNFATRSITSFLKRILLPAFKGRLWPMWGRKKDVLSRLKVIGMIDETRSLVGKGTVVVVPTHFSNLDSILIGYTLDEVVGLPAFSFAAGLNLYDYEIVGYFINRLGAYKIDRRKKNPIYLQCIKTMTTLSLIKGVNNIFFPGGTRSRSGSIEDKLKLGLLGSIVEAQRKSFEMDKDHRIFVVPLVVSYHNVLEAKGLIDQHLVRAGREKYIRSRDVVGRWPKIREFIRSYYKSDSEITLSLGAPMDALGNKVNMDGESRDERGETINVKNYFSAGGNVVANPQRESIYTKILGTRIAECFLKDNVVLSSHLVAFIVFQYFRQLHADKEFYSFLNTPTDDLVISLKELEELVVLHLSNLKGMRDLGKLKLSDQLDNSPKEIIFDAIEKLSYFHYLKPLVLKKNDKVTSQDLRLLFFYHNRMAGYELDKTIPWPIHCSIPQVQNSIV